MRTAARIAAALCAMTAMSCLAASNRAGPSKLDYLVLASMADSPLLAMAAFHPASSER
jgi:hypothetical protein